MLEVTNLDTRETKYITVSEHDDSQAPALVAGYALRYAEALLGLPSEVVPHSIALWPGGDEETDDAA